MGLPSADQGADSGDADAGVDDPDSGSVVLDSGVTSDSGTRSVDSGVTTTDGGVPGVDGGGHPGDSGTSLVDAGVLHLDGGYIFMARSELMQKPMTGAGWALLKSWADAPDWGVVNLNDGDSMAQTHVMAAALVYARSGDAAYRTKVISYVQQAPGTETGPEPLLAPARILFGFVVAADLVGMPLSTVCNNGQTWGEYLRGIRTKSVPANGRWPTLEITSADTSSNWGAHALSTHLAVSYALEDSAGVQRDIDIFRRFLGDPTSPAPPFKPTAGYRYLSHGATWDMSPTLERGINPASATDARAGALIEDILRFTPSGADSIACCTPVATGIEYSEETFDGFFTTLQLLRAHGIDTRHWSDDAPKRAFQYYVTHGGPSTFTVNRYLPYFINYLYGTSYATNVETRPYRKMGFGSWLFSGPVP